MATEKLPASQKTSPRRKKAAVLALAGVVGIGAAATMANWTDQEVAGAELEAGTFNLQIATTEKEEKPEETDWEDSDKVGTFTDLGLRTEPWGPGDYDEAFVHVRLDPATTHNANLTSIRMGSAEHWIVDGPDGVDQVLTSDGEPATFPVTVRMDETAPNTAQGATGEVIWKFTAEQQPSND